MAIASRKMSGRARDVESIFDAIGSFGAWQWQISVLSFYMALVTGSILQGYNFIAAKLDHWCDPLGEAFANWTSAERRQFASVGSCEYWARRDYGEYANMSFVEASERSKAVDDQGVVSRCMLGPQRWEYESTHYGLTIQNEWDLVCERAALLPTTQMIVMVGFAVGVWLFGHVADAYGRRTVICWLTLPSLVVSFLTAIAPNYWVFFGLRFVQGGLIVGIYTTIFILNMETITPKYRNTVGYYVQISWGVVLLFPVALFAYYIRHWRYLQLAYSAFGLGTLLFYSERLMPESPRWLILHERYDDAERVLYQAAKRNGHRLPEDLDLRAIRAQHVSADVIVKRSSINVLSLISTRHLRNRTFVLIVIWIGSAFTTYGITFYGKDISGVPYVAMTALGLSKAAMHVIGAYMFKWWGRRRPLAGMFWLCAVSCFLILLTIFVGNNRTVILLLSIAGIGAASGVLDGLYVYTAEIYPTIVRNVGFTTCSGLARIGSGAAPYIADLSTTAMWWVPSVAFGWAALIGGGLIIAMPEVADRSLPDSIADAERVGDESEKLQLESTYGVSDDGGKSDFDENGG